MAGFSGTDFNFTGILDFFAAAQATVVSTIGDLVSFVGAFHCLFGRLRFGAFHLHPILIKTKKLESGSRNLVELKLKVLNRKRVLQTVSQILLVAAISLSYWHCGVGHRSQRIAVWHSMRPAERVLFRTILLRFEHAHPGWDFTELYYETEQARTNFIISALGGSGPALLWGPSDNIGPLVELSVIKPLESYFSPAYLDSFITQPIAANTWFREHLYQIADRVGNHLCLVYNRKLVPEPPETMSQLLEMGKRLSYDANGDGKIDHYALAWNYIEPYFFVPFIGGFGGWLIDDQNQPTLNTNATVQAAQFIYDLANVYQIIPKECDYEIANALFKDGYAAMIINGPWSWATYIENKIDIGITRIPLIDATGRWPTPMVSPMGYSMNVNLKGEQLQITLELLRYLTSPEVELEFTCAAATIPSRREANRDSLVWGNQLVQSSYYQMQVGRLMPVVTEMRWIWDAMRPGYQSIFTGGKTPQQAAAEMQKLALKLIRENRE